MILQHLRTLQAVCRPLMMTSPASTISAEAMKPSCGPSGHGPTHEPPAFVCLMLQWAVGARSSRQKAVTRQQGSRTAASSSPLLRCPRCSCSLCRSLCQWCPHGVQGRYSPLSTMMQLGCPRTVRRAQAGHLQESWRAGGGASASCAAGAARRARASGYAALHSQQKCQHLRTGAAAVWRLGAALPATQLQQLRCR
jgi:hypothetical protein